METSDGTAALFDNIIDLCMHLVLKTSTKLYPSNSNQRTIPTIMNLSQSQLLMISHITTILVLLVVVYIQSYMHINSEQHEN